MAQRISQPTLPLFTVRQCEQCLATLSYTEAEKSRRRWRGHVLCFRHQLAYKKAQLQRKRFSAAA